MANDCRPTIQACALQVARLEPNGVPDPGANNLYRTNNMISLGVTADVSEGDEFEVDNACGATVVSFKDCDRLNRLDLTLSLAVFDPELTELLVGGAVLTSGDAVGYKLPALNEETCPNGVSLEVWAKRVTSGGSLDSDFPYMRFIFPKTFLHFNSATFENGPLTPDFSGFAVENPNWFDSPTNDWDVDSDAVMAFLPVTSVPTTQCGYLTVEST